MPFRTTTRWEIDRATPAILQGFELIISTGATRKILRADSRFKGNVATLPCCFIGHDKTISMGHLTTSATASFANAALTTYHERKSNDMGLCTHQGDALSAVKLLTNHRWRGDIEGLAIEDEHHWKVC